MADRQFFVAVDNEQVGPIDLETVRAMARDGVIGPSTLVWSEGMADWAPLSSTPLRSVLEGIAAPPPMRAGAGGGGAFQSAAPQPAYAAAMASGGASAAAEAGVAPGPILGIGFVDAIKRGLKQYATFQGRASRSEFWWFTLFSFLVGIFLGWIPFLGVILVLGLLIPGIAVGVRRLHDTDRTGWWYLIGFVPLIGFIVLLIFFIQASQPQHNRFG